MAGARGSDGFTSDIVDCRRVRPRVTPMLRSHLDNNKGSSSLETSVLNCPSRFGGFPIGEALNLWSSCQYRCAAHRGLCLPPYVSKPTSGFTHCKTNYVWYGFLQSGFTPLPLSRMSHSLSFPPVLVCPLLAWQVADEHVTFAFVRIIWLKPTHTVWTLYNE